MNFNLHDCFTVLLENYPEMEVTLKYSYCFQHRATYICISNRRSMNQSVNTLYRYNAID